MDEVLIRIYAMQNDAFKEYIEGIGGTFLFPPVSHLLNPVGRLDFLRKIAVLSRLGAQERCVRPDTKKQSVGLIWCHK